MQVTAKRILIVVVAGALLFLARNATAGARQEEDEKNIGFAEAPQAVQVTFRRIARANPIRKVTREKGREHVEYEAEVKIRGIDHSIVVQSDGKLLEIERAVEGNDLPVDVKTAVRKEYPGAELREAEAVYRTENLAAQPDFYEVEIQLHSRRSELKVSPSGEILLSPK